MLFEYNQSQFDLTQKFPYIYKYLCLQSHHNIKSKKKVITTKKRKL
jgi:hypothetical protein